MRYLQCVSLQIEDADRRLHLRGVYWTRWFNGKEPVATVVLVGAPTCFSGVRETARQRGGEGARGRGRTAGSLGRCVAPGEARGGPRRLSVVSMALVSPPRCLDARGGRRQ